MQADDNEATVATAIDRYNQACEPLLDHFREAGLLSSIDTGAPPSSTHQFGCDDFSSDRSDACSSRLFDPSAGLAVPSRLLPFSAAGGGTQFFALTQTLLSPPW